MRFNDHSGEHKHAFLSPSQYHWLNYDEVKLNARWHSFSAAARGTDLHELAHEAIRLKIFLAADQGAIADYVHDGIALKMTCEQLLLYSSNCFGTPDTLSFRDSVLRIHDLKTGITKASMRQLEIYSALFCLEYEYPPEDIEIILRIYQREDIIEHIPVPEWIREIMDKIVYFDSLVIEMREAEL